MNRTIGLGERISLFAENVLAWLVESGALGGVIVLAILAAVFSGIR